MIFVTKKIVNKKGLRNREYSFFVTAFGEQLICQKICQCARYSLVSIKQPGCLLNRYYRVISNAQYTVNKEFPNQRILI
jgi:hypothetical protein